MNTRSNHSIALSGASGFVGTWLRTSFEQHGWSVQPLGRNDFQMSAEELAEKMGDADVVVNLAGAPIISRWTDEYKKTLYDSRIKVTKALVEACAKMQTKPAAFISASAVGYYAAGGPYTETKHKKDSGFLGRLAQDWEEEARKAETMGIRTVIFRFGVVLGRGGGALQQMLTPFRLGLGGIIGDGSQPFSWIHIRDLEHAYETVIDDKTYSGIYNLTTPEATTNKGLTEALGKALGRPTLLTVPNFVLRLRFGDGAQVLSSGQAVIPERLLERGFTFQFTDIEKALIDCLS